MNTLHSAPLRAVRARTLSASVGAAPAAERWCFSALRGRLVELSEELPAGALSFAAGLVVEAQASGEPVAWVAVDRSVFYPPDFGERGIDLAALSIVRVPAVRAGVLAAEWLLRSGAFGLLVIDAGNDCRVSEGSLGRLARLAERSAAVLLFLTRKSGKNPSIGSIISLRGTMVALPSRRRSSPPLLACELRTVKDKRSAPGERIVRYFDGPRGLC